MTDTAGAGDGGLTPQQYARLLELETASAARQAGDPQPLDAQLAYFDSRLAALTVDSGDDVVPDYPDQAGAIEEIRRLRAETAELQQQLLIRQRQVCILEHGIRALMNGSLTVDGTAR